MVQEILPGLTVCARRFYRLSRTISALLPVHEDARRRVGAIAQFLCGIIIRTNRWPGRRNDPARRRQDAGAGSVPDTEPAPGEGGRPGVRAGLLLRPGGPGPGQVRDGAPGRDRRAGRPGRVGLRVLPPVAVYRQSGTARARTGRPDPR